jgi:hypothetical protein
MLTNLSYVPGNRAVMISVRECTQPGTILFFVRQPKQMIIEIISHQALIHALKII